MTSAENGGDLVNREALKKALNEMFDTVEVMLFDDIIATIDNAPSVDIKDQIAGAYNEGYMCGNREAEKARKQGELADEVWKLYEKHQSHLATHVIEFGDELKELLGKYQKEGEE